MDYGRSTSRFSLVRILITFVVNHRKCRDSVSHC